MRSLSSTVEIVDADDPSLSFDYHWPLMSLPLTFGTRLETVPGETPYLAAEPERIARWRDRIGNEGFRIGVSWRGHGSLAALERSFAPDRFAALAANPGVRLISLQKGEGEADLAAHPELEIERLEGLDEGPGAFLDTAAAMQCLDLVISSDTAVPHLARRARPPDLGSAEARAPTGAGCSGEPIRPGTRRCVCFRQSTRDDWEPVFAEMQAALQKRLAERSSRPS